MATALKVTTIGNSTGVILPKEVPLRLKVERGDVLYLEENQNGVTLSPYDQELAAAMTSARRVMKKCHDGLRKLAE
jgi:putative addiction module antidote